MPSGRATDALFTDFYELTMAQAYWRSGVTGHASFSLFFRRSPPGRGYLVFAGLETILDYLEEFRFSGDDLEFLASLGQFEPDFLDYLVDLEFSGQVRAMREGTICFPNEPVIEVNAPVIEAQIIETFLLNQATFQTNISSKAARVVQAADGRTVFDFGARRAHGTDAAMLLARSAYLSGAVGTSNVKAAARYNIAPVGTMAHSFVMAFEHEADSFRAYAATFPESSTFLVDTYDPITGLRNAVEVGREMAARGHRLVGVRLDSGNLNELATTARSMLDEAGLTSTSVVVSGGLDEFEVEALIRADAPIDGFGIGTKLGVSADAPYLDSAYKLVEYMSRPVLKLSADKQTLPGCKQVFRTAGDDGTYTGDVIARLEEEPPSENSFPLLESVMADGRRTESSPSLGALRDDFARSIRRLPEPYRRLRRPGTYPVEVSGGLRSLQAEVVDEVRGRELGES